MVVLTVGNAYLLVLADESRVSSFEAQAATASPHTTIRPATRHGPWVATRNAAVAVPWSVTSIVVLVEQR